MRDGLDSYTFQDLYKIMCKIQVLRDLLVVEDYWVLRLYQLPITGAAYVPFISWEGEAATAQLSLSERAVLSHWTPGFLSDSAQQMSLYPASQGQEYI
jgi:hypothetical protein